MRHTVQRLSLLLLMAVCGATLIAQTAFAGSADVGIEPAYPRPDNERTLSIFIMQLKPSEQGKDGIRLVNSGKEAHTVEIYPTDSSSSVDGSFSCRQHAEEVKDVGTWVQLDKTKLTLEPGQQTIVDFTVDVPKNAGPGEHDGCLAVQDVANLPAKSGAGVLLGFRSAIRLAVTVPGKIVKQLEMVRVDVKHVADRGVSVTSVAKNSGNVSLDVTARAQLVSIFGNESEIKDDAKYPIMQGATTGWAYTFPGSYWGGIYKARTSLSYNSDPKAGIGQDQASQQRIRKDSGWFVVLPDPLAAVAELIGLGAVVWLAATPLRRWLRRKHVLKHWQKHTVLEGETLATIARARGAKWKQLAKRNHIKAPYLLEAGRVIMVPKPRQQRNVRKPKKASKSELDWLADEDTPAVPDTPVSAAVRDEPIIEKKTTPPVAETSWEVPAARPETPIPQRSYEPNPHFPEPETTAFPDWRQGASEDELRELGVLSDSSNVPQIQDSWNIDEETDSAKAKKTIARTEKTKTRKSPVSATKKKRTTKTTVRSSTKSKK